MYTMYIFLCIIKLLTGKDHKNIRIITQYLKLFKKKVTMFFQSIITHNLLKWF